MVAGGQIFVSLIGLASLVHAQSVKHPIIHTNHPYLNIRENSRVGTEICIIDASSQTHVDVVVLAYDNATRSRVELIPISTGINSTYRVVTKVIPDRETERTWFLTFQAHDSFSDTLWTLPLHIDDVNDNAPYFEHSHYHGVVGYDLLVGSKVLHVKAMDADEGPNSVITYSMQPYNVFSGSSHYRAFTIDPMTGDITLKEHLQHGLLTYHYQVNATDSGNPQLTGSALVDIGILDFIG